MLVRNGINQNLRAKGKTFLFFSLIMVLTIIMIFSVGINSYCNSTIENANKTYKTIAVLEYMGSEYPSDTYVDSYAREAYSEIDFDALEGIEGVKFVTKPLVESMYLDGYTRKSNDLIYKNNAVLVLRHFTPLTRQIQEKCEAGTPGAFYNRLGDYYYTLYEEKLGYRAVVEKSIYSYSQKSEIAINVIIPDEVVSKDDVRVICNGIFLDEGFSNGLNTFFVTDFLDDSDNPCVKLDGTNEYLLTDSIFTRYAEKYRNCNNYVSVINAVDISYVYEFQQGNLYLKEGEFPSLDDENSCIVSWDIYKNLNLKIGDEITLNKLSQNENNIFDVSKTDENVTFKISGVTNDNQNYTGRIYRNKKPVDPLLYGYTLCTISLDNELASSALLKINEMLPLNVRVTLLDQGYSSFTSSFVSIKMTTRIISYITGVGVFMVVFLLAFLFIGREKENIKTLILFGTPKKKINVWMLSGVLSIGFSASILGGITSILLLPLVLNGINKLSSAINVTDLLYSETVLGTSIDIENVIKIPILSSIITILLILVLITIFSILFLDITYKSALPNRGVSKEKAPKGDVKFNKTGPIKFSLTSIKRGRLRSIIVPIISFVLTVVIILLSSIYQGYSNNLKDAYKDIDIEGQVVSLDGSSFYDLALKFTTYKEIMDLKFVEDAYISAGYDYYLEGTLPAFGNGGYAQERKESWITSQPELVMTNNLKGTKEFYYVEPNVTYLEGYDEGILKSSYPSILETYYGYYDSSVYPIICNNSFMEQHNLSLGDEVNLVLTKDEIVVGCKIVGSFIGVSDNMYIYAPLSLYIPLEFLDKDTDLSCDKLYSEGYRLSQDSCRLLMYNRLTLSTCRFFVKERYDVEEIREMLHEKGYSSPDHMFANRTTILLRDSKIVELKNTLGRYVSLGKMILGLILVVVSVISFVISWLMINGRKKEFLIMRGFGVKKKDVFLSFFLEQFILFLIGFILGLIGFIFVKAFGLIEVISLLGLLISYAVGASIEINILNKVNLMELMGSGDL